MRLIFIVLFALNVVFFFWTTFVHEDNRIATTKPVLPASPKKLFLPGESRVPESQDVVKPKPVSVTENTMINVDNGGQNASDNEGITGGENALSPQDPPETAVVDQENVLRNGDQPLNVNPIPAEQPEPVQVALDYCFSIPSESEKEEIDKIRTLYSDSQWEWRTDEQTQTVDNGFWVYLPKESSLKAARANAALLKKNKFRDYYIITSGRNKYAISLGLFRVYESALGRQKQVQDFGLSPKLEKRTKKITYTIGELVALQRTEKPIGPEGWPMVLCDSNAQNTTPN